MSHKVHDLAQHVVLFSPFPVQILVKKGIFSSEDYMDEITLAFKVGIEWEPHRTEKRHLGNDGPKESGNTQKGSISE